MGMLIGDRQFLKCPQVKGTNHWEIICKSCGMEKETTAYLLFDWPALLRQRLATLEISNEGNTNIQEDF